MLDTCNYVLRIRVRENDKMERAKPLKNTLLPDVSNTKDQTKLLEFAIRSLKSKEIATAFREKRQEAVRNARFHSM